MTVVECGAVQLVKLSVLKRTPVLVFATGNKFRLIGQFVLTILFFFLPLEGYCQLKPVISAAENYLIKKMRTDEIYAEVKCVAQDVSYCPTTGRGQLFATYFLVQALQDSLSTQDKNRIIGFLQRARREESCWSYSQDAPIDADDTAFALQLLYHLGEKPSLSCLEKNFYHPQENLFSTFALQSKPKIELVPSGKNNLGFHPEVNANISQVLYLAQQSKKINFDFLRYSQANEGYWYSYFYPSYYYSTFTFLRTLCITRKDQAAVAKGIKFILKTQNQDGAWGKPSNAYDTALALLSLSVCNNQNEAAIKKGQNYLIKSQRPDGSWASNEIIWQYPFFENPFVVWNAYDNNRVITTSLAVSALKQTLFGGRSHAKSFH